MNTISCLHKVNKNDDKSIETAEKITSLNKTLIKCYMYISFFKATSHNYIRMYTYDILLLTDI